MGGDNATRSGANLNTPVIHNGKPLGFTVADMLPERRWAVDEHGKTLGKLEFEAMFRQFWLSGRVSGKRVQNEEPSLIPIPSILDFVSQTRTEDGRLQPIGWLPEYDSPMEIADKRTAGNLTPEEAARREATDSRSVQIDLIMRMAKDGTLTAEQAIAQMSKLMGPSEPAVDAEPAEEAQASAGEESITADAVDSSLRAMSLSPREAQVYERIDRSQPIKPQVEALAAELGLKPAGVATYYYSAKKKMEGAH
jgi:hypothetical protein